MRTDLRLTAALLLSVVGGACHRPPAPAPVAASSVVTTLAPEARDGTAAPGPGPARTWRFASFFNRVKRQVAARWWPDQACRRNDPNGALCRSSKRYTELQIELTSDGRVQKAELMKPSGLGFLDQEAISAFQGAGPFANPPQQLADADGVMRFRFGFLFDPNGPPELRWFRYHDVTTSADAGAGQGRDAGTD